MTPQVATISPSIETTRQTDAASASAAFAPTSAASAPDAAAATRAFPFWSSFALIAANLVPLVGVLYGGWNLSDVLILYWAESGIVAFYTLIKMAIVARWFAPFIALFFIGHFGGFMTIHFLFIYDLFVAGGHAHAHQPRAIEAIAGVLMPLWPALAALFLSHGVSFVVHYRKWRASVGATVTRIVKAPRGILKFHRRLGVADLMTAPYRRIIVMQFTLIFGSFGVLAFKNPLPALALLIVLKTGVDLYSHRGDRGAEADFEA
jgi:hypothetical protein